MGVRVEGEIPYHICFGDVLRREIGVLWRECGRPGTSDAVLASVRLGDAEEGSAGGECSMTKRGNH